jgi:polyphosphate kinase 2 (PPK2 family)
MPKVSLSRLLRHRQRKPKGSPAGEIERLQLEMLRIQQGIYHGKGRAVLVFEGFDAAGKGGCIRTLTSALDPRGVQVHPIGAPTADEQGRHWLYRFWRDLPPPGTIAVFDRSWYGRVLVERVEKLASPARLRDAYREINQFEKALLDDGVTVLKFFLGVSRGEQRQRFEDRLNDPYKQWKLTEDDLRARARWDDYVEAVDKMFAKTHRRGAPWRLVPADHKAGARREVLRETVKELASWGEWIRKRAAHLGRRSLREELEALGRKGKELA